MAGDRFPLYQKPVSIVSVRIMLRQSTSPPALSFLPALRVGHPDAEGLV